METNPTTCFYRNGVEGYWSCEDCPCPDCRAATAVDCDCSECRMIEAEEDWFYASWEPFYDRLDRGTYAAMYADAIGAGSPEALDPTFVSDVDLIALELVADRLAGHRTSYLWA